MGRNRNMDKLEGESFRRPQTAVHEEGRPVRTKRPNGAAWERLRRM